MDIGKIIDIIPSLSSLASLGWVGWVLIGIIGSGIIGLIVYNIFHGRQLAEEKTQKEKQKAQSTNKKENIDISNEWKKASDGINKKRSTQKKKKRIIKTKIK